VAWLSLRVEAQDNSAELISDTLMELGALSASIEDAHAETPDEQPIFGEPGDPPPGLWRDNIVSALFDDSAAADEIMQALQQATGLGELKYTTEIIAEQDWVRATQSQFEPIRIRDDLWIVPSWHEAPDPQALNIVLDPGLAFGTGSHPTTHLCLSWLADHVSTTTNTVLDYGCGSGILAIAASKLGAARVTGVDIDEQAIQASRYNAEQNGVSANFSLAAEYDGMVQDGADIVVANILSSALTVLAPALAAACRAGGRIALSGILREQAEYISDLYTEWFDMDAPHTMEDWVLLTGVKR
jgi:ribosomal protein L11 methyltransferase